MSEPITRLGGHSLPSHGDEYWPRIKPGHWEAVTCQESADLGQSNPEAAPWMSLTDPDGSRSGRPQLNIVWGSRDEATPLVADNATYDGNEKIIKCVHAKYVLDAAPEAERDALRADLARVTAELARVTAERDQARSDLATADDLLAKVDEASSSGGHAAVTHVLNYGKLP